jgi:hypothetical protein
MFRSSRGRSRWTLRLIADEIVELGIVDEISYKTAERILKKEPKRRLRKQWCIGRITSEFIWRMEEVLDVYERGYDPLRPVTCFDERSWQLLDDVFQPIPTEPGDVLRQDYHYIRNGTCVIMIAFETLAGKTIVEVRRESGIMLSSRRG